VSALDEIVDRAIDYANRVLHTMPSYENAAAAGLRELRDNLARKWPDDPAVARLEAYLGSLIRRAAR
jgi:hypothetical protein